MFVKPLRRSATCAVHQTLLWHALWGGPRSIAVGFCPGDPPRKFGLEVSEYAPNKVKKTIVGVGHADKQQIMHMVKLQLPGVQLNGPDSSDALAIAICHSYHAQSNDRFLQALEKV